MRKPPATSPPAVVLPPRPEVVTLERRYRLITPLFGGGVEPQTADPVTVIRGLAARGHLRFWWRACRGGRFAGDLQALKEAEDALWGAASTPERPRPSQVQIAVEVTRRGTELEVTNRKGQKISVGDPGSPYSYAAFPLQKTDKVVLQDVEFTLRLTFPKREQAEVEAALWAWETFGGIGGRTRRGFGALHRRDSPLAQAADSNAVRQIIDRGLSQHLAAGAWPPGVPHLGPPAQFKIIGPPASNPLDAWRRLIDRLRAFRQAGRPGRTQWPEADEIRRLAGMPERQQGASPVHKFPRAALGLPIVFHSKDEGFDATLTGVEQDRMASRLILRPLAAGEQQFFGLALVLAGPTLPPGKLQLKVGEEAHAVEAALTPGEAQQITPLGGKVDVLLAFLTSLDGKETRR